MNIRQELKNALSSLPKEHIEELMIGYDCIAAEHGEDIALNTIFSAFHRLRQKNQANASYTPLLSPRGKTIADELAAFSEKKSVELDAKKILRNKVNKFNAALSAVQISVNGELLAPEIFECMRVKIPEALKAKERTYSAFAEADTKNKLKELSVVVKM